MCKVLALSKIKLCWIGSYRNARIITWYLTMAVKILSKYLRRKKHNIYKWHLMSRTPKKLRGCILCEFKTDPYCFLLWYIWICGLMSFVFKQESIIGTVSLPEHPIHHLNKSIQMSNISDLLCYWYIKILFQASERSIFLKDMSNVGAYESSRSTDCV